MIHEGKRNNINFSVTVYLHIKNISVKYLPHQFEISYMKKFSRLLLS